MALWIASSGACSPGHPLEEQRTKLRKGRDFGHEEVGFRGRQAANEVCDAHGRPKMGANEPPALLVYGPGHAGWVRIAGPHGCLANRDSIDRRGAYLGLSFGTHGWNRSLPVLRAAEAVSSKPKRHHDHEPAR